MLKIYLRIFKQNYFYFFSCIILLKNLLKKMYFKQGISKILNFHKIISLNINIKQYYYTYYT